LPGYQRLAVLEEPQHNLLIGPKRLTEQKIDSLFVVVIGFRTWRWSFTRPEFGHSEN